MGVFILGRCVCWEYNRPLPHFSNFPHPLKIPFPPPGKHGYLKVGYVYGCLLQFLVGIRAEVLAVNFPIRTGGSEVDLWGLVGILQNDREVSWLKTSRYEFCIYYIN